MEKEISDRVFYTPQEHLFAGSTPEVEPRGDGDWYVPEAVTLGRSGIEEAMRKRAGIFCIRTLVVASALGLTDKTLMIKLQKLDPETGQTVADPEVIGVWDDREGRMMKIDVRDLTEKLFAKLVTYRGIDYRLRRPGLSEGQRTNVEG